MPGCMIEYFNFKNIFMYFQFSCIPVAMSLFRVIQGAGLWGLARPQQQTVCSRGRA